MTMCAWEACNKPALIRVWCGDHAGHDAVAERVHRAESAYRHAKAELSKWHLKAGHRGTELTKLRAALAELVKVVTSWVEEEYFDAPHDYPRSLLDRHDIDPKTLGGGQ